MYRDTIEEGIAVLPAWHCASCGDWTDALILQHRALTVLPPLGRARTVTWDPHESEKWLVRWRSRRDLGPMPPA